MNVFLWVNSDLDGVGSTILLGNIFKNFEYTPVFFGKFEQEYFEWYDDNFHKYDKIFVVGMPSSQDLVNKLDDKKIVFVSDQPDVIRIRESTLIQETLSSCSKLLYKKFSKSLQFPAEIKKLIAIIDDYNGYNLKLEESKILNALFRRSGSRRFYNFVNTFWEGFRSFSDSEIQIYQNFQKELTKEVENLELFGGVYKNRSVIATFSEFSAAEVANCIINTYTVDIVIVVNIKNKFVSFRKSKDSPADIVFMAQNLCNGGGQEFSSGGSLTSKFLEFTNTLKTL